MSISMQYGDVPFRPTRWELQTEILPGSQNQTYEKQVLLICALSQMAFVNYHIPSLHGSIAGFFHRKITTDLYQDGDGIDTFTRVKDQYNGRQLLVACSSSKDLRVRPSFFPIESSVGITAVRMLEDN